MLGLVGGSVVELLGWGWVALGVGSVQEWVQVLAGRIPQYHNMGWLGPYEVCSPLASPCIEDI